MPCAGNAPSLLLLFFFFSSLRRASRFPLLVMVLPVRAFLRSPRRLRTTAKKAATIRPWSITGWFVESYRSKIVRDTRSSSFFHRVWRNVGTRGKKRPNESEKTKKQERNRGGRKLWKQVLVRVRRCKLQVYRGKTSRRRRWSVVRAGRAGPTPILIKRSHKRLTNWLYVRRFIGVPEQDVKMFQS